MNVEVRNGNVDNEVGSEKECGFSKTETLGVIAIIGAIILFSLQNFKISELRARDEQRKNNATNLVHALEHYHDDFGVFPPSTPDGRFVACGEPNNVIVCEWGKSKFADLSDPTIVYMDPIPVDPSQGQGISLRYISVGSEFQILTHLEYSRDPARSKIVQGWGLDCGSFKCNYGVTGSLRPVTKKLGM